ncbi:MAG: hypothetical protein ACF8MJ_12190 [Phycisphaerales bacterium JB050]
MNRILLILCVVFFLSVAVLFVFIIPGLRNATTSTWNASSGGPVSDRFLYAMFPAGDGSEFAQYMPPRVVLNAHSEIHDDSESYRIFDASGTEHLVPKSALTFEPNPQMLDQYIAVLNETLVAWGSDTDYRSASVTIEQGDGESIITLVVAYKDGSEMRFTYTVHSGTPTPISSTFTR